VKKILALVVASMVLALVFGCGAPPEKNTGISEASATPEPTAEPTPDPMPNDNPYASAEVGDTIQFGAYTWRVLDVQDGKALIITENIVEKRAYNMEFGTVTWETCTLRSYLNGRFYRTFSAEERALIIETANKNPENQWYGAGGGNNTADKIFLLSLEEVDQYFGGDGDYAGKRNRMARDSEGGRYEDSGGRLLSNAKDGDRIAVYNESPGWWWLRSPGGAEDYAACIGFGGWIEVGGFAVGSEETGVRPALWLNLASLAEIELALSPSPESRAPIIGEILNGEMRNLEFGGYTWRVLDMLDDKALIMTEDVLEARPYYNTLTDMTWETSTLRKYLNGRFYNAFSLEERALIIETVVRNPDNLWFGTEGGNDTADKVFLLSLEEADQYFGGSGDYLNEVRQGENEWFVSNAYDGDRVATYSDRSYGYWWLRSPGGVCNRAAYVYYDGQVSVYGTSVSLTNIGVRPALWLRLYP